MRLAAEGDAWNAPELAIWHPVTYHVLILYEDTKVVDWNISEDEQTVHSHTDARSMVLSPDGNLLLTSDVYGTLSIWMIPECRLTYQMRYDELVTDLAFSPEGTRFYDIRGMFCNVWEPDALIRADEIDRDDMSSAYETLTSEPKISNDDNSRVPITALVHSSSDKYYCSGKEDGSVTIYNIPAGTKDRKLFNHSSSSAVIKLAWSASDKFLASADDSGRIIAKRLESPSANKSKWAVFPLLDIRTDEAVECFLFSPRDQYLLIAGPNTARVISLKSKEEISRERHSSRGGVWINHPTDPAILVHIQGNQESQYVWKTMRARELSLFLAMSAFSFDEPSISVVRSTQIRTEWFLLEIEENAGRNARSSQYRYMELVNLQRLQPSASSGPVEPVTRHRVEGLAKHVRLLIGFFQDRVVFLDYQFWLCTWNMELVYSSHKRHFFLPKDWLSPNNLRLITLNKQGTLLCPRNGEAAIVRSGLAH
ncbi:hypothetical protein MMC17_007521 [Xylographa soralifera]|nr:hypothetical protein [Xylographa soralifera]